MLSAIEQNYYNDIHKIRLALEKIAAAIEKKEGETDHVCRRQEEIEDAGIYGVDF